ncbi:hypothetical protein CHUAL_003536 [Chamberlinius hualienensis]
MKLTSLIFVWMLSDWRYGAAFNILVFPVHLPSRENFYEFLQTHLLYADHNVSFLIYKSDTKNLQIRPPPQTILIDDFKEPHSLKQNPRSHLEEWEQTALGSVGTWSEMYSEVPAVFLKSLAGRCHGFIRQRYMWSCFGKKIKSGGCGLHKRPFNRTFFIQVAAPYNPAYLPVTGESYNLNSLLGRFSNAYSYTRLLSHWDDSYFDIAAEAACTSGNKCISAGDYYKRLSLVFINSDLSLEIIARPLTPTLVFLAGLHCQVSTLLPKSVDSIARSYRAGVIYVSLITALNGTDLPQQLVDVIIDGLGSLPYAVFWKTNYPQPDNTSHPKNVFMDDTFSVQDVLGHGRTRLAVTLCDINSIISGVYHGVPIICIPISKEQLHVARTLVVAKSIGAVITLDKITSSNLAKTAQDIISNSSYRQTSRYIGDLMRDKSETPSDRLVFWVEYAIRRKGLSNLRIPAVGMSLYRFLFLDAAILLGLGIGLTGFAAFCIIKVVNYRRIVVKAKTAKSE